MPELTIVFPSGYREPLECAAVLATEGGWTAIIEDPASDSEDAGS